MVRKRLLHLLLATCIFSAPLFWLGGCVKSTTASIPGSANAFDANAYLTLVTTDNIIQTTKTDLTAGSFPPSIVGNVKSALNGLIQAYNVANVAYQAYHTSALVGASTVAQQTTLQTNLDNVQAATANLTSAKTVVTQ